jgi:hypothetical protein
MRIGIVCYPHLAAAAYWQLNSKALADKGHHVHFITYQQPVRLSEFNAIYSITKYWFLRIHF